MKKIINWVGGSFFRTLGRFLFYIALAFIFSLVISKINLFAYVVKADIKETYDNFSYSKATMDYRGFNESRLTCADDYSITGESLPYNYNGGSIFFPCKWRVNFTTLDGMPVKANHKYSVVISLTGTNSSSQKVYPYLPYSDVDFVLDEKYPIEFKLDNHILNSTNWFNGLSTDLQPVTQEDLIFTDLKFTYQAPDGDKRLITFQFEFVSSVDLKSFSLNIDYVYTLKDSQGRLAYFTNQFNIDVSQFTYVVDEYTGEDEPVPTPPVEDTTNKEILDSLTDTTSPDLSSLNDMAGWLPPGPLDSVLNLPLNLLNSIVGGLNSTCSSLKLPLPFVNETLTIPCISTIYSQIQGLGDVINFIGLVGGSFILYYYLTSFYKWVEDTLSLKDKSADWGGF